MADFFEVDFLAVETNKSGDAITIRYQIGEVVSIHVVDGGFLDTGKQIGEHIRKYYGGTKFIDHVVLTHSDQDHANGLRIVLEEFEVGALWMHRPWLYADELIDRFETYNSVEALRRTLRSTYSAVAELEDIAIKKNIKIYDPFQGEKIGAFTVLAPTKVRYLDLLVSSNKTPEAVSEGVAAAALEQFTKIAKAIKNLVKAAWAQEYFPADGTSSENEMSVVQYAYLSEKRILLTGDSGRDGLSEAANYVPNVGLTLPGVDYFQVPHHGGRHNVSTEILNRWLGKPLSSQLPEGEHTFTAICSSAKADEHHPKNSVVRAMIHRGGFFTATEGQHKGAVSTNAPDKGWGKAKPWAYPDEQEE